MGLRYGIESALKLEHFISNLLTSFATIYEKLDSGRGFRTVEELLQEMSHMQMLHTILPNFGYGIASHF